MSAVERTVEAGRYRSLSEFVSEAVQLRLKELHQVHGGDVDKSVVECSVVVERLLCSADHLWAVVTAEGNIRVGLSDFAQERLKGVAGIHVNPVGCEVKKGESFGFVESWMFKFDLRAPVSGKFVRVNEALLKKPFIISEDSYDFGWVAEIRPDDLMVLEEELRDLMGPKKYKLYTMKQRHLKREKS